MNNLTYVDEMEDCFIKQEQNDRKIYLIFKDERWEKGN